MKIATAVTQRNAAHFSGNITPLAKIALYAITYMARTIKPYSINRGHNYASNAMRLKQLAVVALILVTFSISIQLKQDADVSN